MLRNWTKKNHLPIPTGPYNTGCVDVQTEFGENSLFFRLHYPAKGTKTETENYEKWTRWLPSVVYIEAFARFLNLYYFIIRFFVWLYGYDTHIPTTTEEEIEGNLENAPMAIFSHGYGATRFLCSAVCNELASMGYVVAAIEHKDRSASVTYFYENQKALADGKRYYIYNEPLDAGVGNHYGRRNTQLKKRSEECSKLLQALRDLNDGKLSNILNSEIDLRNFKGLLDVSSATIIGHSFGGATAMYTLAKDDRFKIGVILDGWMFPLKNEKLTIKQPTLFLNTQTFHIAANISIMKNYVGDPNKQLYTIKNTTHESQTDTPAVFGYWLNLLMKKLPINTALKIQNCLILQFLAEYAGLKIEDGIRKYLDCQRINVVQDFILHEMKPKRKLTAFYFL